MPTENISPKPGSEGDKLFWLSYCNALKKSLSGEIADGVALFFGSKNQRGPTARDDIDTAWFNEGVFSIGDNLLDPTGLFYVPSTRNSYSRNLDAYLSQISFQRNGDKADEAALIKANTDLKDADKALETAETDAINKYNRAVTAGITDLPFSDWAVDNARSYNQALADRDATAQRAWEALAKVEGPLSAQLQRDKQKITSALNSKTPLAGLNMACTEDLIPSVEKVAASKTAIKPAYVYKPSYVASQYVEQVREWAKQGTSSSTTTEISLENGRTIDTKSFGHKNLDPAFQVASWIGFGTSGSSEETTMSTNIDEKSVTIKLIHDGIAPVSIEPGSWNIGDPHQLYQLSPSTPTFSKAVSQVAQMVLVRNLRYEIKWSANAMGEFESKYDEVKRKGGYIRIFGITIGFGSEEEKTTHSEKHTEYSRDNGTFITNPPPDSKEHATIAALYGQTNPISN